MNPILHIRTKVLDLTQAEFARIAAVSQGTVSKWENGELRPDTAELSRIRDEARRRGVDWEDRWFWEAPSIDPARDEESPQ